MNGECEETVVRDGQPTLCGRPLDERGERCDRWRDHVSEQEGQ